MTISLSLEDLSHRYPEKLIMQGLDLYQRDRVGDLWFDGGLIETEVVGERDEYRVRVSLNGRGIPVDTDCSCPSCLQAGSCKHIVALLVKLITEKIKLNAVSSGDAVLREEEDAFPLGPEEISREYSLYHELPSLEPDISEQPSIIKPSSSRRRPAGAQRWSARLELQRLEDNWIVRPVLVYIKKDGTPGRRDTFFERKRITEPLPAETEKLINLITRDGKAYDMPLAPLLEFLDPPEDGVLPFYSASGRSIRYGTASAATLQFDPVSLRDGEGKLIVNFNPEIALGNRIFSLGAVQLSNRGGLYFLSEEDIIFYPYREEKKDSLEAMAQELLEEKSAWDMNRLNHFYRRYRDCFGPSLVWGYVQKRIREISAAPRPVMTGRDLTGEGALFQLSFDYGKRGIYHYGDTREPYERRRGYALVRIREDEDEETMTVFFRDLKMEEEIHRWIGSYLRSRYPALDSSRSDFAVPQPLWEFLEAHGEELLEKGLELRIEREKGKISRSGRGALSVVGHGYKEWLSLSLEYGDGIKSLPLDLTEFMEKGLLRGKGEIIILTKNDRAKLTALLSRGELSRGRLQISPLDGDALEMLDKDFETAGELPLEEMLARTKRLKQFESIESVSLPSGFRGELRPYQKGGYDWLHFLNDYGFHGCLADDMGLGKTVQTLCFLQQLKETGRLHESESGLGTLILAPVTTLVNWQREAAQFAPDLSVSIHTGSGRARSLREYGKTDLVLTSYQTFLRDAPWLGEKCWNLLIMDEAQAVKNWQSKTRRAVKTLNVKRRLALTGTPVENGTEELWSLFDILDPGLLGPRELFRRRYLFPIERDGDFGKSVELRRRIAPFLLRRKKEDVLKDLPDKEETVVYLDMDPVQRQVYEEAQEGYRALVEETLAGQKPRDVSMVILSALLRLRQIALIPALAGEEYKSVPAAKLDFLLPFLDDLIAEDHRVLVFSQFVQALGAVEKQLARRGIDYAYLDGQTRKRTDEIDRFQSGGGPGVFLISLKAGGVGINLTAADYVVLLDPWWNPAVESQAVDRAHRIGQKRSVMVYRPVVRDTVEEKVLALQDKKRDLVSKVITEEGGFLKTLSREDVIGLFC